MESKFSFYINSTRTHLSPKISDYYELKTESDYDEIFKIITEIFSKNKQIITKLINTKEAKSELLRIDDIFYIVFDSEQSHNIMNLIQLFYTAQSKKDIVFYIDNFLKSQTKTYSEYSHLILNIADIITEVSYRENIGELHEFWSNMKYSKVILDCFIIFHEVGHIATIYGESLGIQSFKDFDIGAIIDDHYSSFIEYYEYLLNNRPNEIKTKSFKKFLSPILIEVDNYDIETIEKINIERVKKILHEVYKNNREYLIRELGADLISLRILRKSFFKNLTETKEFNLSYVVGIDLVLKNLIFYNELYMLIDFINYGKQSDNLTANLLREYLFREGLLKDLLICFGEDKFSYYNELLSLITISYNERFYQPLQLVKNALLNRA
jgi:hypothetical protein